MKASQARSLVVIVVACFVLLGLCPAQAPAEPELEEPAALAEAEEAALAAPAVEGTAPAAYRIRRGDTLSISVLGAPEYSGSHSVRADGTILFSDDMVGAVEVAGKTATEATETLSRQIGEYVRNPTVILTISRFRVMVIGDVRRPGEYEMSSGSRLLDAVNQAGGVQDEERDLAAVYLTKADGSERRYNLRDYRRLGEADQNPLLEPGDRVSVARAVSRARDRGEYKVSGAVKKPGRYWLKDDDDTRLSDAIEEAGRWTDDGNPRSARLVRADGSETVVDLTALDANPRSERNAILQAGDELIVPRNCTEVNILGGVKEPGQYMVPAGTTLLELITTAGGLKDNAILDGCAVVRSDPPVRIPADLKRLFQHGDMSQNPVLEHRDVVFVPERPPQTGGGSRTSIIQSITDNAWRYLWLYRYIF